MRWKANINLTDGLMKTYDWYSDQEFFMKETKIAVIGLGYVGLPLAAEFGKKLKQLVTILIE